jgi:hypothetical protein
LETQEGFSTNPWKYPTKVPPDFRSNINWQRWENQPMIMGWSSLLTLMLIQTMFIVI